MHVDHASNDLTRDTEVISYGPLTVDFKGFAVSVRGNDVPVTLGEFLLMTEFARNPFRVIDRGTLAAVLKGHPSLDAGDAAARPSARAVDVHISRLRRKLSAAGYDCIRTMRFVGYRFVPLAGLAIPA